MNVLWVVVADSSRARLFTVDHRQRVLERETLVHPESRLREGAIVSDRPGRDFSGPGGGRHGMRPSANAKEEEANSFAAEVCRLLEAKRTANELHEIILVAGPPFLGLLRSHLSDACSRLVTKSISKGLVRAKAEEIAEQLIQ